MSKQQIVLIDSESGHNYTLAVANSVLTQNTDIVLPEKNGTIALLGDLNIMMLSMVSGATVAGNTLNLGGLSATEYALANFENVITLPEAMAEQVRGTDGVYGTDGAQGVAGVDGDSGAQGVAGVDGLPGVNATVTPALIATLEEYFQLKLEAVDFVKRWETPRKLTFKGVGRKGTIVFDGSTDATMHISCSDCTGGCVGGCTSCSSCTGSCVSSCLNGCSGSN